MHVKCKRRYTGIRANVIDRTFPRCNTKQTPLQRAIGQKIANDLTHDLLRREHCTDFLRSRSYHA